MIVDIINLVRGCWSNLQLMVRIVPAIVEIVIFSSGKNGNRFSLVSFTNHNLWGVLQYQKKPVPQKWWRSDGIMAVFGARNSAAC